MCGLFASRDSKKFDELFHLNTRRGQTRMSVTKFLTADKNAFRNSFIEISGSDIPKQRFEVAAKEDEFLLGHIQAPTSVLNLVHPAQFHDTDLWHNGILKEDTIQSMRDPDDDHPVQGWDTWLMARALDRCRNIEETSETLSVMEGSFACFMHYDDQLYCFRNEISPLFVDGDLNFSSIKFKGSNSIEPGIVFGIDFLYNRLDDTGIHFTTANNPYIL